MQKLHSVDVSAAIIVFVVVSRILSFPFPEINEFVNEDISLILGWIAFAITILGGVLQYAWSWIVNRKSVRSK